MQISEMNWMMVEEYLKRDDRAVLPLGSTEQHAYLSLSVDSILAERLAVEAAEPLEEKKRMANNTGSIRMYLPNLKSKYPYFTKPPIK